MGVYKTGTPGKWRVVIHLKGHRQDFIIRGTKRDAVAAEARERRKVEAHGRFLSRVAPRFSDFCVNHYRHHAMTELRKSTWALRSHELVRLIEHFGETRLTDITTEEVFAYRSARIDYGLAPRTINNELMALAAVMTYARKIGAPCAEPVIEKLKVQQGRHAEAWTQDEVDRLYAACQELDPALLPMIVFLINTGLRKGELIALPTEHVDIERRLVRVWPHSLDGGFNTKSGRGREIPLSETLMRYLDLSGEWVFPRPDGSRYAYFPKKRFSAVVQAAGLTGGPHKTRHTFASQFLANQPDIFLLGRLMGHGDARVTALYGHLLPGHLEKARGAVDLLPDISGAKLKARAKWRKS